MFQKKKNKMAAYGDRRLWTKKFDLSAFAFNFLMSSVFAREQKQMNL